ncbi:MAG: sporulation protein YqfC [Thermaerobacter sp.]|nr:sporulation protein YqfC [Thermaerobacter sp.]
MDKIRPIARLAEALEIPPEVWAGVPRVEMVGQLQLRVENHRGLEYYQPHRLVLRTPDGRVVVHGQDLVIAWMDQRAVLVTGQVRSVEFGGASRD